MKLKKYAKKIKKLAKKYPDAKVLYANDYDEVDKVIFSPTEGTFYKKTKEWVPYHDKECRKEHDLEKKDINSVCVN